MSLEHKPQMTAEEVRQYLELFKGHGRVPKSKPTPDLDQIFKQTKSSVESSTGELFDGDLSDELL
jgi:hypothetical protein